MDVNHLLCAQKQQTYVLLIVVKLIISTSDCNLIRFWYEFNVHK